MTRHLLLATALLALVTTPAAAAPPYESAFSTVDAVDTTTGLEITGILVGQSTATTYHVHSFSTTSDVIQRCEHYALLSMMHPGRFTLEVSDTGIGCKLTANGL